jgi:hypothetical protein
MFSAVLVGTILAQLRDKEKRMSVNTTTNDPYAYLDRALPNSPVATYRPPTSTPNDKDAEAFGEDGFGFDDFLDIINPLQHIPGISSIYREITGDQISPGSRLIGGSIFGGGIGLAASFVNAAIEDSTGKDIGAHFFAVFTPDEEITPGTTLAVTPQDDNASSTAPNDAPLNFPVSPSTDTVVPEAPLTEGKNEIPAVTPIGLEWKGQRPDFEKNLEQARAVHTQELSQEQLNSVFQSFRVVSEPAIKAPQAAAAYQKAAATQNAQVPATRHQAYDVSETYPDSDTVR